VVVGVALVALVGGVGVTGASVPGVGDVAPVVDEVAPFVDVPCVGVPCVGVLAPVPVAGLFEGVGGGELGGGVVVGLGEAERAQV